MTDKIGQTIEPGVFIAYGHALGRCAGLRIGRVEAINTEKNTITVLGIDDDISGRPQLLTKKSTLLFPDRMIVLPSIPDNYRALYDSPCVAAGKHQWVQHPNWTFKKQCSVCKLEKYS